MIREHDILVFAPGVRMVDQRLCDAVRGASWPLNTAAVFLLARSGTALGPSVRALAEASGLSIEQTRDDVLRFVWQLNRLALVNVERPGSRLRQVHEWALLAARLAPVGAIPAPLTRRRAIDTRSAARGLATCVLASLPRAALVAAVAAALAAHLAVLAGEPGTLLPVVTGVALGVGIALHEGGHAALLRGTPSALVTRGRRTYVLHAPLPPSRRAWVALAGPGLAAAIGVVLVTVGLVVSAPAFAVLGWPLGVHAIGLTVIAGDGRVACAL